MPVRIVTALPHQYNFVRNQVLETTVFVHGRKQGSWLLAFDGASFFSVLKNNLNLGGRS